jgi:hypothetical protein
MEYKDFSYRHGKELIQVLHPDILEEVHTILVDLNPFPHGGTKGLTAKDALSEAFASCGWQKEKSVKFKTEKKDFVDLYKANIALEMEFSRFEMFFRDFFRFMLLYAHREIDVGVIITLHEMAFAHWHSEAKSYRAARASYDKLVGFLEGDYASVIAVPLWCIGIE